MTGIPSVPVGVPAYPADPKLVSRDFAQIVVTMTVVVQVPADSAVELRYLIHCDEFYAVPTTST